jgi:hypothetical protein
MSTTTETSPDSAAQRFRATDFLIACAGVLLLCAAVAAAASARPAPQTAPGDALDPRTYAPESRLFLVLHATGVQKYTCQPDGAWLFTDPDANLYKKVGAKKPDGAHFLDFGTGRPVWRFKDGSSVEAARYAGAPAGAGNVPALLLQAVATTEGADGERLTRTTWVQRLNTSGGVAPAGTCTPGDRRAVAYTADYFFWRSHGGDDAED